MVMQTKTAEKKFIKRQDVKKEEGVAHLAAIHSIVYGNNDTAPPGAIFVPYTASERDELLAAGAARELNDQEALVVKAGGTPAPAKPAAVKIADPKPHQESEDPVDEDPIG